MPKKAKNLFKALVEPQTLSRAVYLSQQKKRTNGQMLRFNKDLDANLSRLRTDLINGNLPECHYRIMVIHEPKERIIQIAPYDPFRIIEKAMIVVLKKFYYAHFVDQTYACIKGRGIHKCMADVKKALNTDTKGTLYCLKGDIKKFYNNINHTILKWMHRSKISDQRMLNLIYWDIDCTQQKTGLPIGAETSQYYANFYLTAFDRICKEVLKIKYFFRYMDDFVILADTKEKLHQYLKKIQSFLSSKLRLKVKENYQIFPLYARQIDFVGYRMNHYTIMLRKHILKRFYKKLKEKQKELHVTEIDVKHELSSYYGWINHLPINHQLNIYNYAKAV